jgi:dihydroorotate dehydrogenase (NAD+) catalytic subunit
MSTVDTSRAVSLEVDLGKLRLRNPVLAASGTYGYGEEYADFVDNATIGGFVTKSVTPRPRRGNPHPRVAETPSGMLNSIGLENAGIDHFLEDEWPALREAPCLVILSIAASTREEYVDMCAKAQRAGGVKAIEINLSCPNVKEGGRTFGGDPAAVQAILRECRGETDAFLIAKLTPNADPVAIAKGAEAGGADGISLIHTLWASRSTSRRRPLLAMGMGGLSGPAVKPIPLAMTYQVCRATSLPVIGLVESPPGAMRSSFSSRRGRSGGHRALFEPARCRRLRKA